MKKYPLFLVAFLLPLVASAFGGGSFRFRQMPETSYYGGINSIAKDSLGRMWFSGTDALYMFNGRQFENRTVPNPHPEKPVDFRAIKVGGDGRMFVGTNVGLFTLDYLSQTMLPERDGDVTSMDTDGFGRVWALMGGALFSLAGNGGWWQWSLPADCGAGDITLSCTGGSVYVGNRGRLYSLDIADSSAEETASAGPSGIRSGSWTLRTDLGNPSAAIVDALDAEDRTFVLTLKNGLYECSPSGTVSRVYRLPEGYDKSSTAKELYRDGTGMVWVATQSGLLLVEPSTGETKLLSSNLFDDFSLPNNSVWSIYPDPDGGVWIGTYGGKLAYLSDYDNDIRGIRPTPGGLSHPIVSTFTEDASGNLWIGTEGGGICRWNRDDGSFTTFRQSGDTPIATGKSGRRHLNSNMIKKLVCEGNVMWIAAFNGGVMKLNLTTGALTDLKILNPTTGQPLAVYDFLPEADGGLWLADPDAELMYWDGRRVENILFYDGGGKKIRLRVEALFHDELGRLWLVTRSGVHIVDVKTRRIVGRYTIPGETYAPNNLCCWCRTSASELWFGTRGGGVNRLDAQGRYLNIDSSADGSFTGRTVFGMLEDRKSGNLWLSTDAGLFFFDSSKQEIVRSGIDEVTRCGAYYLRSCFLTSRSEMLFGGTDGFIMFNPDNFKVNPQKPRVWFTGLKINDEAAMPSAKDSPLSQAVSTLNGLDDRSHLIRLSHRQSVIEIGFASDSYLESERNSFAYRMIGISDNWTVLPSGQQNVRFANLSPGKYRFEIRCANNDGVWGDRVSSLTFKVNPSPLASPWALVAYLVLLIAVTVWLWNWTTKRKMLEQNLKIEQERERNLRELTRARMDFFTNISHDLKTPLTLVLDPLKQLEKKIPEDAPYRKYVDTIGRNVLKIQRMISELLKFRQIETLKMPLNLKSGDIVKFIDDIFSLFEPYASSRQIETEFNSSVESYMTRFDYDAVEKVFTNLISNAVKYTTENGYVSIRISPAARPGQLSFIVTNSGSEIPEDRYDSIFEPFNSTGKTTSAFESHTGLGLAIVKELVSDMHGTISVFSADSTVSFTVVLPLPPCEAPETVAQEDESEGNAYDYAVSEIDNIISDLRESEAEGVKHSRKQYDVLVVEDDASLRNYLEQRLSEFYNVYTAMNGADGAAKAGKVMPNIVVTDLYMPDADGFELCRSIRSDIRTSHIPIIMLSAAGENRTAKIDSLECGANVFMDKPVDIDFLLKQISNLLKNQDQLKELYSKKYVAEPSRIAISSMDEELIRKAVACIEKNIENEYYGVDDFASDMAVGRTRLYQKITELTGMSIKEFILDIRLKRAGQLLRESDRTIAEISTMTGFSNPKYFSVCFKRHFSQTPTEFKNDNKV